MANYYIVLDAETWDELYRVGSVTNKEVLLHDNEVSLHRKAKKLLGCECTPWIAYDDEVEAWYHSYGSPKETEVVVNLHIDVGSGDCVVLKDHVVTFPTLEYGSVFKCTVYSVELKDKRKK